MDWSEAIEQHLPARRDDEPESLRRDIADELGDHLACALEREQRRCPDEQTARNSVLERFGDPGRIARQLWLEWMKGKIMTQRILIGTVLLMVVVTISAVFLSWMAVIETHSLSDQLKADRRVTDQKLLERVRAENQQLREMLASLTERYARIKVRLVYNDEARSPVENRRVFLKGGAPEGDYVKTSGSDGVADFGLLPVGLYNVTVDLTTPQDADVDSPALTVQRFKGRFSAKPGEEHVHEVVCAADPPAKAIPVAIDVVWPADLREDKLALFAEVKGSGRQVDGSRWQLPFPINPIGVLPEGLVRLSHRGRSSLTTAVFSGRTTQQGRSVRLTYMSIAAPTWTASPTIELPEQSYEIPRVIITSATSLSETRRTRPGPVRVSRERAEQAPPRVEIYRSYTVLAVAAIRPTLEQLLRHSDGEHVLQLEPQQKFAAIPGKRNQWRIELSDEIWQRVRESLKELANEGESE